jgi:cellulose synthase/poly-beta-1,6-N-acetylglucosamine synthase-like glycosyltransferase
MIHTLRSSHPSFADIALASLALGLTFVWVFALRDTLRLDAIAYALAAFLLSLDVLDLLLRLNRVRALGAKALGSSPGASIHIPANAPSTNVDTALRPYALLLSVHNLESVIDEFLAWALPYQDRMWIVDDCSTDHTTLRLRSAGFRCLSLLENVKKPAALRFLLKRVPADIHTVIVMDPDCRITAADDRRHTLESCLLHFQHSGAAALCPRIGIEGSSMLEGLQRLEYMLGFCFGRRSLADFCTAAGLAIYRRDALESALARHSLSIYAEDLETTLDLLGRGERIYYDARIHAVTEVPRTVSSWFSQRVGWYFGLCKVYVERWQDTLVVARRTPFAFYQYVIYLGVFGLLFLPLKIVSCILLALSFVNGLGAIVGVSLVPDTAATNPLLFVVVYLKYLVLVVLSIGVATGRRERSALLPLAPFYFLYALLQILPAAIGCCNWIALKFLGRRLYDDHYETDVRRLLLRNAR